MGPWMSAELRVLLCVQSSNRELANNAELDLSCLEQQQCESRIVFSWLACIQYIIFETLVEGFPVAVSGYRGTQSSSPSSVFVGARNTGKKLSIHRCVSNQKMQQGPSYCTFLFSLNTFVFSLTTALASRCNFDSIIIWTNLRLTFPYCCSFANCWSELSNRSWWSTSANRCPLEDTSDFLLLRG